MKERKSDKFFDPLKDMRSEWIDEAIDINVVKEKNRSKRINLKKIVSIAACIAILVVGTTCIINAEEISSAIKSLFVREQELIDPHAVVNTVNGQEDIDPTATSLWVDKVFIDGEYYYFYINIHKPSGFEQTFLYYEGMGIYTADGEKVEGVSAPREDLDPNLIALSSSGIQGKYVSETDFEAVIKLPRTGDSLPQGDYSFRIYGLTEAKPLAEPNDENMKEYESEICADLISDDFSVSEKGLSPLPSRTIKPDTEFEVEGYKFVLNELTISPMSVELIISDELHQVMEIDGMHFNAINLFCAFEFSKEYDPLYHGDLEKALEEGRIVNTLPTREETEAFYKFKEEHGILYNGHYELGFELADEAKKYWRGGSRTGALILGDDNDFNAISLKAHFSAPIYEDEILAIGFFKDTAEIPAYDERYGHYIDAEVWRNSAE